jgi:hypothetical protein
MTTVIGYITPEDAAAAKKGDKKSHIYLSPARTPWATIPVYIKEKKSGKPR